MNNKITLFAICCLFLYYKSFAQTPATDLHWQLKWEDNFDGTFVNTTKWGFMPPWGYCGDPAYQDYLTHNTTHGGNHEVSNGTIKLISKKETSLCTEWTGETSTKQYSTGVLVSNEDFQYGFFEIRCKIPELSNSPYTGKGFKSNFWLYRGDYGDTKWNEIDIFEIGGEFNTHTCNVHYKDISHVNTPANEPYWTLRELWNDPYDFNVNFDDFHKFSCEWTPSYIRFYFDDKLIRATNTEYASKLSPMYFIINIATPEEYTPFAPKSLFPYPFEIDYVRVYKLEYDCIPVIEIPNYNTYYYAVKKSISLSGLSSLKSGEDVSLRASSFIELKDGFEVPLGAELYLDINPCETPKTTIKPNFPNPFRDVTTIECYAEENVLNAKLYVCDAQGVVVKNVVVAERGKTTITVSANELPAVGTYTYYLVGDSDTSDIMQMVLSEAAAISQNYPNPFHNITTIDCYIPPSVQNAALQVYNPCGYLVKTIPVTQRGTANIQIPANELPAAGVYTYLLICDGLSSEVMEMIRY